jgi:hypothetical protein
MGMSILSSLGSLALENIDEEGEYDSSTNLILISTTNSSKIDLKCQGMDILLLKNKRS